MTGFCKKGYCFSGQGEIKFSEECGVFGGISYKYPVAPFIQQGLFMLQHRGQESAGICVGEKNPFIYKNKGLVMEVLSDRVVGKIRGRIGISHVRYSTQGGSDTTHAQPYVVTYLGEKVAVAHNGNVKAAVEMRKNLEKEGEVFITTADTEMILKKIIRELCKAPSKWTFEEVGQVLTENFTGGAWSILFLVPGKIFAFRDPMGYRPLSMCESKDGVFVSSEDTSFQMLENKSVYHIHPGEGVEISRDGFELKRFAAEMSSKKCVFEHIYFARPDSNVFGRNVYSSRVELGRKCALENPVNADIVIPVMDSGFAPALGFSQQSGIPLQMGLMRNRWVGRTFILPEQQMRSTGVRRKLTPIKEVLNDKRVVVIDDSIVRGTTSREIVRLLKESGAKEVHFRSASPKILNTCQWGVDIPTKKELIANKYEDICGIRDFIEADSLAYLSIEGLKEIFQDGWCYSCLLGDCENPENENSCKCSKLYESVC